MYYIEWLKPYPDTPSVSCQKTRILPFFIPTTIHLSSKSIDTVLPTAP